MKRKFYDTLIEWKAKRASRFALLIDGARRIGKSWIAEAFAKAEYASYLLIDFSRAFVFRPGRAFRQRRDISPSNARRPGNPRMQNVQDLCA